MYLQSRTTSSPDMSSSSSSNSAELDSNTYDGLSDCILWQGPGTRDPECGICHEAMEADAETVSHTVCQNTYHKECFDGWTRTVRPSGRRVTCPICRATLTVSDSDSKSDSEFYDEIGTPSRASEEGYFNSNDLIIFALGNVLDGVRYARFYDSALFRFGGWGMNRALDAVLLAHMHLDRIPDLHATRTYIQIAAMADDVNAALEDSPFTYEILPDRFALIVECELPQAMSRHFGMEEGARILTSRLWRCRMDDQSRDRLAQQRRHRHVENYRVYWAPPNWHGVTHFLLPIYRPHSWFGGLLNTTRRELIERVRR